jgi:hypothetical protein
MKFVDDKVVIYSSKQCAGSKVQTSYRFSVGTVVLRPQKRGATTMFRHTERLKGLYRDNRWSKLHRNLTRTGTHGFSARHYDAALLGPLGYTIVTR